MDNIDFVADCSVMGTESDVGSATPSLQSQPRVLLPTEIILSIIERLDHRTSLSTAMVCRLWKYLVRPQLFRQIRVRRYKRSLALFCDFLDATPDVPNFIKNLNIHSAFPDTTSRFPRPESLSPKELLSVMLRLPSIRSLTLSSTQWSVPSVEPDHVDFGSAGTIPSVEFLDLSHNFQCSPEDIPHTLGLFPNLHAINFGGFLLTHIFDDDTLSNVRNTNIRILKCHHLSYEVIDFMTALFPRNPIQEVDFKEPSGKPDELVTLFRVSGSQLTHVGFAIWYYTAFRPDLGLSQCTSLRSVRIFIKIFPQVPSFNTWKCLLSIMEQMPPTILEFILHVECVHTTDTDLTDRVMDLGWEELEDKLLDLSGLRTFTIELVQTGIHNINDLEIRMMHRKTLLKERLSRFGSQRNLEFDFAC